MSETTPVNKEALTLLAKQMVETLAICQGLMKTIQDEVLVSTRVRIEHQKDIATITDTLKELKQLHEGKDGISAKIIDFDNHRAQILEKHGAISKKVSLLNKRLRKFNAKESLNTQEIIARLNTITLDITTLKLDLENKINNLREADIQDKNKLQWWLDLGVKVTSWVFPYFLAFLALYLAQILEMKKVLE